MVVIDFLLRPSEFPVLDKVGSGIPRGHDSHAAQLGMIIFLFIFDLYSHIYKKHSGVCIRTIRHPLLFRHVFSLASWEKCYFVDIDIPLDEPVDSTLSRTMYRPIT